jgi:uncharacterized membrane protein (Fun14 family)
MADAFSLLQSLGSGFLLGFVLGSPPRWAATVRYWEGMIIL